jgi:hypothetical protein
MDNKNPGFGSSCEDLHDLNSFTSFNVCIVTGLSISSIGYDYLEVVLLHILIQMPHWTLSNDPQSDWLVLLLNPTIFSIPMPTLGALDLHLPLCSGLQRLYYSTYPATKTESIHGSVTETGSLIQASQA